MSHTCRYPAQALDVQALGLSHIVLDVQARGLSHRRTGCLQYSKLERVIPSCGWTSQCVEYPTDQFFYILARSGHHDAHHERRMQLQYTRSGSAPCTADPLYIPAHMCRDGSCADGSCIHAACVPKSKSSTAPRMMVSGQHCISGKVEHRNEHFGQG